MPGTQIRSYHVIVQTASLLSVLETAAEKHGLTQDMGLKVQAYVLTHPI